MTTEKKPRVRMTPEARCAQLITIGLKLAMHVGMSGVTRTAVAKRAGVVPLVVNQRFGGIVEFHKEVLLEAGRKNRVGLLQSAYAEGHAINAAMKLMDPGKRKEIRL